MKNNPTSLSRQVRKSWRKALFVPAALLLQGSAVEAQYCTLAPPYTSDGNYISQFTLGDIHQTSSSSDPSGYSDFTSQSTTLQQNGSYTISVDGPIGEGTNQEDVFAAWIDYNGDIIWQVGEKLAEVLGELVQGTTTEHASLTFQVPADALAGPTRLRIRISMVGAQTPGTGNMDPCMFLAYGETEDYTVNIEESSSVKESNGATPAVYPNPTKGDLIIGDGGLKGMVLLEFLDLAGRNVLTEQHAMGTDQPLAIHLDGKLAPGNYVLRIISTNAVSSQPVVVR